MFTICASGRTAGVRVKENVLDSGEKRTQLTFSLYTKVKEESQWITCTLSGKYAETIAPWLTVARENVEEGKDKYVSRLVNIVGRLNVNRSNVDVPYQILDDDDEVIFEGTTQHFNTSIVIYVDNIEFLDASPEGAKDMQKTKASDLDDATKEKLAKLAKMKNLGKGKDKGKDKDKDTTDDKKTKKDKAKKDKKDKDNKEDNKEDNKDK